MQVYILNKVSLHYFKSIFTGRIRSLILPDIATIIKVVCYGGIHLQQ